MLVEGKIKSFNVKILLYAKIQDQNFENFTMPNQISSNLKNVLDRDIMESISESHARHSEIFWGVVTSGEGFTLTAKVLTSRIFHLKN